jgi:hypothetical protein
VSADGTAHSLFQVNNSPPLDAYCFGKQCCNLPEEIERATPCPFDDIGHISIHSDS